MNRTFHKRVSIGAGCGVILLLVATFCMFWAKSIALALLTLVVTVFAIERMLHSEYQLTTDELVIRHGRFSRTRHIPLAAIQSCRPMSTTFGLNHFLLIVYGDNRLVAVEPVAEQAFVKVLREQVAETRKGLPQQES